MNKTFLIILFCLIINSLLAQNLKISGRLLDSFSVAVPRGEIFLQEKNLSTLSNENGFFEFDNLSPDDYTLFVSKPEYTISQNFVSLKDSNVYIEIILSPFEIYTGVVLVPFENTNYGLNHFRSVDWDNMVIGAAKKSEIIKIDKLVANLSANNSRQIYAKVAGLNIWENDNSGIQLNIGGRGLSPNRTSNFNTRQNGYDISADALGYPESYYTPPAQALEQIEIIRGAASLQYGTQFGGMLNFRMKKGSQKTPLQFISDNTYGSFNFFNSFNSIGGTCFKDKLNYYAYYQYKRGNGWRPFSEFEVHNGYAALEYKVNNKLKINLEQTSMFYIARQPGGLTDNEFYENARQSKRPRNWFRVNWNISAISIDYQINRNTKLNIRNFGLFADRQSLGNLTPINRVDYGAERDLIKGFYQNFGNESRLLHRYKIKNNVAVALAGFRVYKGFTRQMQGLANADSSGTRSDFEFLANQEILQSNYNFPSFNAAAFVENYFTLGKNFSITPGLRYEYINTSANGYYQNLVLENSASGIDTLVNEAVYESKSLPRSIFLAGIGVNYRPNDHIEIYTNFSQNYRAVNFNDIRILNPNQLVDQNLKDESGFNADLGIRGKFSKFLNFDLSLFYLRYNQRIGNIQIQRPDPENPVINQLLTLKTNIGDARVFGFESLIEFDIWQLFAEVDRTRGLVIFSNVSVLDGRYLESENSFASGKKLEFVAPVTIKSGLSFYFKNLNASYQFSFVSKHYSDATNSELSPIATVGAIPAYLIMDLSLSYKFRWFTLQGGINNLSDQRYFTRRATSYPGPGIIPADGRGFYIGLRTELNLKRK
jgi:Fe(3+) dicitrate transport protein